MGTDKGLILKEETPWASVLFKVLGSYVNFGFYSINETQLQQYAELINPDNLLVDKSFNKIPSGLKGLLTHYSFYPNTDIFTCACDLINFDSKAASHIFHQYTENPNFEAYIPKVSGYLQPLSGIYSSRGLRKLQANFISGKWNNKSIKYILHECNTFTWNVPNNLHYAFKNFNSPSDLSEISNK